VLEKHHNVRILDEGLVAAVKFSHRYLPDRQLPDKAVSVLDTACARLALGQNATPPAIEDATRQIDDCAVQTRILERETALGADHSEGLAALAKHKAAVESRLGELKGRWEKERDLVGKIREVRGKLEAASGATGAQASKDGAAVQTAADPNALRAELAELNTQLEQLQGETPLMRVCVDSQIVGEVVAAWTGIPIGKMLRDEMQSVLTLETTLGKRVIGQNHALDMLSERIRTSKAGLEDPGKPIGVFLLVGPSGVGKTETALALADLLYGGERNMITINMSEFQEAHTVSTLKGSPPGYVGYGEGGVLTEAVRRRPYSVVLLDEVEKAHPDVLELFFQVFDKGKMEDGEGREIDFKNTIIILTSNAGTDTIMKLTSDPETMPVPLDWLRPSSPSWTKSSSRRSWAPGDRALLPGSRRSVEADCPPQAGQDSAAHSETHRIALTHDEALIDEVAKRCTEVESGARNVDNILTNTLLPEISRQILGRLAERQKLAPIHVTIGDDGVFVITKWTGLPAVGQAGRPVLLWRSSCTNRQTGRSS
jgi:type VI secretion system protein VasG